MKVQIKLIYILIFTLGGTIGYSQNNNGMQDEKNPLLCNPDSGICEIKNDSTKTELGAPVKSEKKPVKIIYYTDPICSSCWGIEPQLRKLKLEYGNYIEIEYRMGGLLPDWSYNSGGISKPSDVAHHWDEVSGYYDMPIDGDVWLEDPLPSSYPPSIAFKAAQMQDEDKAILFLREIREMVFLKKINITKWEYLEQAAKNVGLDPVQLKTDYEGKANEVFKEDLNLGRNMGVRGFPTIFFMDSIGNQLMVYGTKPYASFENAVLTLHPDAAKKEYDHGWNPLFTKYHSLTAKEFSVLNGIERNESEKYLDDLVQQGHLKKLTTKNGSMWTRKD